MIDDLYSDPYNDQEPYADQPQDPPKGPAWTDPDTTMPDWLHDPNSPPSARPAPPDGYVWKWDAGAGIWGLIAGQGTVGGAVKKETAVDRLPMNDPLPTGGGGGVGGTSGSGPDYSQMLPYSPYREYGPFSPAHKEFSYEPYTQSSYDDLEAQPGYKDDQARLQKQIEAGAAYRGMLRSGMTLGNLWNGLDENKSQRFAEFDNRRFRNWGANRQSAYDAFLANYGIERDIYDRGSSENDRFNNYRYNTEHDSFQAALDKWKAMVSSLTQIGTAGAN